MSHFPKIAIVLVLSVTLWGCSSDSNNGSNNGGTNGGDAGNGGNDANGGGDGGGTQQPPEVVDCSSATAALSIEMSSTAYDPAGGQVSPGDVVMWTNKDPFAHTVTSGKPSDSDSGSVFDSGNMSTDDTFCLKFPSAGTYDFFCMIHPSMMQGSISVE